MAGGVRDNGHDSIANILPKMPDTTDKCKKCGVTINLKFCAKCKCIAYCCKEHQKADWTYHKKFCKLMSKRPRSVVHDNKTMVDVTSKVKHLSLGDNMSNGMSASSKRVIDHKIETESLFTECVDDVGERDAEAANMDMLVNKITHSPHTDQSVRTLPYINRIKNKRVAQPDIDSEDFAQFYSNEKRPGAMLVKDNEIISGSSEKFILESEDSVLHAPDYTENSTSDKFGNPMPVGANAAYLSVVESRNKALSVYVTDCLNAYGVCVIDNFLGDSKGTDILDEVIELYEHGELSSGQLVNATQPKGSNIRGDVITWVDGTELGCGNVSFLVSSIDAIMLHCHQTLGNYTIKGRSKAMVAVYPGSSTGFLRHVDNPGGDGRCVTCIYYMNKGWNSKNDGGLLRIFPEGQNKIANVEPKFDRLLFFWSDRRNPHEVLPSYKPRYAVTVWYYDEDERRRAVKRFKGSSDEKKHVYPLTSVPLKVAP